MFEAIEDEQEEVVDQPEITYKSGSSPIMILLGKFLLEGSDECVKDADFKLVVQTSWNDERFTEES